MSERTYRREDIVASREAWRSFSATWGSLRKIMADKGVIYPPTGSHEDDRDDPTPSQRAIIWRALDWRHTGTLELARRSRSWGELVGRILAAENGLRDDAALAERNNDWDRQDEPDGKQALQSLAAIVERIRESAAR